LECHDSLASTQDHLMQLAELGAPQGCCVVAGHQSAGRGQHGRSWSAEPSQGLLFSLLLRPRRAAGELSGLPSLLASLALLRSLAPLELDLALRWPNDLVAGQRKLAGILMEGRIEGERYRHLALGVGLNLSQARADFPPELDETAVSLRQMLGQVPCVEDLLAGFLHEMEGIWARLEAGEDSALIGEWKRHWKGQGRHLRSHVGRLRVLDLDVRGALLLESPAGGRLTFLDSASILGWEES